MRGACGWCVSTSGSTPTLTAAVAAVARQEGVSKESVRRWLAQADVDDGTRPGVTSEESAEVRCLKAEFKRLREDNEILRKASISFAGSSTPETADLRVHRRVEESGLRSRADPPGPAPAGPGGRCEDLPDVDASGSYRGSHDHRRRGRGQDPRPRVDIQRGHGTQADDSGGPVRAAEMARPAPPPARPGRHVPWRGRPGDAGSGSSGCRPGEEVAHHRRELGRETCRRPAGP